MFEVRKCRAQNLAYTLSIVMDNNIHVLHNNKDEKISFPEELTSEPLLGREELGEALLSLFLDCLFLFFHFESVSFL